VGIQHGDPPSRRAGPSPEQDGLHFPNSFPSVPHGTIPVYGVNVPIGDASKGLCGGSAAEPRHAIACMMLQS
jgi:hypothetical protein